MLALIAVIVFFCNGCTYNIVQSKLKGAFERSPRSSGVHDGQIFDVPAGEAEQYRGIIEAVMKEAFTRLFGPELPIEVEAKVCANWGEK